MHNFFKHRILAKCKPNSNAYLLGDNTGRSREQFYLI